MHREHGLEIMLQPRVDLVQLVGFLPDVDEKQLGEGPPLQQPGSYLAKWRTFWSIALRLRMQAVGIGQLPSDDLKSCVFIAAGDKP